MGVQVPAGTVENPDDLENEVLREAEEETGLQNLHIVKYLGTVEFFASMKQEIHERHFFHLRPRSEVKEEWLHYEENPSGGGAPIAFNIYWCDVQKAELWGDQGALLHKI